MPGELTAELGKRFEIMNTSIKKWTVGSPLQSVLDGGGCSALRSRRACWQDQRIVVDMPADGGHIVDIRTVHGTSASSISRRHDDRGWRR